MFPWTRIVTDSVCPVVPCVQCVHNYVRQNHAGRQDSKRMALWIEENLYKTVTWMNVYQLHPRCRYCSLIGLTWLLSPRGLCWPRVLFWNVLSYSILTTITVLHPCGTSKIQTAVWNHRKKKSEHVFCLIDVTQRVTTCLKVQSTIQYTFLSDSVNWSTQSSSCPFSVLVWNSGVHTQSWLCKWETNVVAWTEL